MSHLSLTQLPLTYHSLTHRSNQLSCFITPFLIIDEHRFCSPYIWPKVATPRWQVSRSYLKVSMVVTNGISHYATCKETPSFSFYEDENLWSRRIYFVNQKDWRPRKYSVICINHFEKRFIKYGKKCYVKVGLSLSEKICILVQWKPSKNDEKNFYCSLRVFFVLKTFKFFSWVFGHVEKKAWLEGKF